MANEENTLQKGNINWYPGHMEKARRQMVENLSHVDLLIELRDARAPYASANPIINQMVNQKPHLIILSKADLADEKLTQAWIDFYHQKGQEALALDANKNDVRDVLSKKIRQMLQAKIEKAKARGIRNKKLRVMIAGIPNVGKSTLINRCIKRKALRVENRPGVTRSLQWVKLFEDIELLDTPGVLWPRFDDQKSAYHLVLIGSLNPQVVDQKPIILYALDYLKEHYPKFLLKRYDLLNLEGDLLLKIGTNKKIYDKGEVDTEQVVSYLLNEFKDNRLGRVSWEPCQLLEDNI